MLPFSQPAIGEEEVFAVVEALQSGWLTTGPRVARFEKEFAASLGAPGALAVNSCTAALHTSLLTLGVGPGDEVITTPMTFVSTVHAIEHVGATPILADVEPDTLNIDPAAVERAMTRRTRVLLPVHYAGHPADLDPLHDLVSGSNLRLVEDAAHAFPASYRDHAIGSGANPVCFSFYATKNLTTGEGGMLTADPAFLEEARSTALHGMSRNAWARYAANGSASYEVASPGWKYNMSDIAAAIGLAQLRKINQFEERRRQVVKSYSEAFRGLDALEMPVERPGVKHAWHLYVLRLRPGVLTIDRDRFAHEMALRNIATSVHFIPVHLHSYYRNKYGFAPQDFPVAYENYLRLLTLPLTPALTDSDVDDVIAAVHDVVSSFRR